MLSKTVQDAINDQITFEFESAYLYLSMSAYCDSINLPGFAHWMRIQYQEELMHAMRLFDFVNDRGGRVVLQAFSQPPSEFDSPLALFTQALAHERDISAKISRLYEIAVRENDYPTQAHLQWFITEQVEEEKNAGQIVEQLKRGGGDGTALLMIDNVLSARILPANNDAGAGQ